MRVKVLICMLAVSVLGTGCDGADPEEPPTSSFRSVPQAELTGFTTAYISWAPVDITTEARLLVGIERSDLNRVFVGSRDDSLSTAIPEGLDPDTEYYYAVSLLRDGVESARSDTKTFRTKPLPASRFVPSMESQREVLGKLTGWLPLRDTTRLRSRSDSLERRWAAQYLVDRLDGIGLNGNLHEYHSTYVNGFGVLQEWWGQNVYSTFSAESSTDEWVVIGSHYDSVQGSPGAIDNGTGVAITLAIAEQIGRLESLPFNVAIVFFDQEELGLIGSSEFAEFLDAQGAVIRSMHNFEMSGWDGDGDRAMDFGTGSANRELVLAYRLAVKETGPSIALNEFVRVGRSDQDSFPNSSVLSEEFASGDRTPHYHTSGDTYETVNFEYLLSATRVALNAVLVLLTE